MQTMEGPVSRRMVSPAAGSEPQSVPHPRTLGWIGTTALAIGGSNQSLFLIAALFIGQGSAAVPLLIIGLLLSLAAPPGWTELGLLNPNPVGGISGACPRALLPFFPILTCLSGL